MRKAIIISLIIIGAVAGFFIYRGKTTTVPVETVTVVRKTIAKTVTVSGRLESAVKADLSFETTGQVVAVAVRVGDWVEKGKLLATLDRQELENQRRVAETNLEKAQADLDRVGELRREFQEVHRYDSPSAELFSQFGQYDAQVRAAEALVANYRIQLEQTQNSLKSSYLTTPIAGTITAVNLRPGELVKVAGGPAVTIADLSPENLYFRAEIPEADLGKILLGQTAAISLDAQEETDVPGVISEIEPTTSLDASGDKIIIVRIDPAEDLPESLRLLGLSGNAEIILSEKEQVLTLPLETIAAKNGGSAVWKIEAGLAREVTVTTGLENEFETEIVSGLTEGDQIATVDQNRLRDGQRVRIAN